MQIPRGQLHRSERLGRAPSIGARQPALRAEGQREKPKFTQQQENPSDQRKTQGGNAFNPACGIGRLPSPRHQRIRVNVRARIACPHGQFLAQVQIAPHFGHGHLPRRDLAMIGAMQQPLRQLCPAGLRLGGVDKFKKTAGSENIQINGVRVLLVQQLCPREAFSSPAVSEAVESPLVKIGQPPRRVALHQNAIMEHSAEKNSREDSRNKKGERDNVAQEDCHHHQRHSENHPQIPGAPVRLFIVLNPSAPACEPCFVFCSCIHIHNENRSILLSLCAKSASEWICRILPQPGRQSRQAEGEVQLDFGAVQGGVLRPRRSMVLPP